MITGVIYKYTSPDGTVYIGQTIDECSRRGSFFLNRNYGGGKFDSARAKFGPENFTYERLVKNTYADKETAKADLDKLETFYIEKYDSYYNGYNSTKGNGVHLKVKNKKGLRHYKDNNSYCELPHLNKHHTTVGMNYKHKPVLQYDLEGNFIAEYSGLSEASRCTKVGLSNISRCCNGISKQCKNFIFKFK